MLMSVTTNAGSGTVTALTFVLIAIGMACSLAVIWWGTVRRRAKAAQIAEAKMHAELAGHAEQLEAETVEPDENLGDGPVTIDEPGPTPLAPPAASAGQPLTLLKGLGPKAAAQLNALGVADIETLAALPSSDIERIDGQMGSFAGRLARDRWIEQAKLLASGDRAGFEATFGKLGS